MESDGLRTSGACLIHAGSWPDPQPSVMWSNLAVPLYQNHLEELALSSLMLFSCVSSLSE